MLKLFFIYTLIVIIKLNLNTSIVNCEFKPVDSALDWWQKSIIYQVYPRSFKDSNGDGIGDLKGIEQMADYFSEIGVGAVWLSPIYKSPMADFGYDITNYTEVAEEYGTIDDLKSLKTKLNSLGIKLILDFVPNHTSNESIWFQKSIKRIDPYTNYYVWKDPKGYDNFSNPIPPNNWISVFNIKSAWTYNEERKQFYLHEFLAEQPDLNYRDEKLQKAMENVIKFWLDAGIDGFRIDAVNYLVEHEDFPDEVYIDPDQPKNEYENLNHNYTKDQPMTFDIIKSWRKILDNFTKEKNVSSRVMLTEAYTELDVTMKYYGTKDDPISQMPFNFQLIARISPQSNVKDIAEAIKDWFDYMPEGKWPNWVIGNHDNFRVSERYGVEMVDALNMIVTLLPGTTITYYGEEIGMEDTFVRWDQTVDPQGIVLGEEKYLTKTRDTCRSPMQWNDTLSAGFSSKSQTWLPVNPNFWRLNVKAQREEARSHLKLYKQLVEARKLPVIQRGKLHVYTQGNWTMVFTRSLKDNPTFVVVINMATEATEPDLSIISYDVTLPSQLYVYASSINSAYKPGDKLGTGPKAFYLRPKTALVLTTEYVPSTSSGTTLAGSLILTMLFTQIINFF